MAWASQSSDGRFNRKSASLHPVGSRRLDGRRRHEQTGPMGAERPAGRAGPVSGGRTGRDPQLAGRKLPVPTGTGRCERQKSRLPDSKGRRLFCRDAGNAPDCGTPPALQVQRNFTYGTASRGSPADNPALLVCVPDSVPGNHAFISEPNSGGDFLGRIDAHCRLLAADLDVRLLRADGG